MHITSDALLPGFDSIQSPCSTSSACPDQMGQEYWVRTSDKQTLNRRGDPSGYRHQLMRGKKTVPYHRGTGADALRTLMAQAMYFNGLLRQQQGHNDATGYPRATKAGPCADLNSPVRNPSVGLRTPDARTA